MKIPSLKVLFEGAKETLLRFPFVILTSIIGAVYMIYILDIEFARQENIKYLYNVVMVCSLGISFLLSLVFICERMGVSKKISYLVQLSGMVLLILYYLTLPAEVGYIEITRYLLFMIGAHLLVSFSPFVSKGFALEKRGFWEFNQDLFLGILIAFAYSGVLYAGLSVAILSFDKLFDVNIDSKRYGQLFFFILGFFNTWFYLSRLPKNIEELDKRDFYPKGLKIFTQYVLLPLVIIYLCILYLYTGKIIVQWMLPMGWVSYLVLGFSITGIFSLLLIEPLKGTAGNNWIKIISKWFYIILYPLIILLFVAILRRTGEYGITEKRYFVFVLAVWLTFIAIYFSISRVKNIKVIPYSLCLVAILSSFGPWGAFSLSEKSQLGRLEDILIKNKILVEGKIVKAVNPIPEEERQDASSIVQYLNQRRSLDLIRPWFDIDIDTIKGGYVNSVYKSKEAKITDLMGIEYMIYKNYGDANEKYYYRTLKEFNFTGIKGYDYSLKFRYGENVKEEAVKYFPLDSAITIGLEYLPDSLSILISNNGQKIGKIGLVNLLDSVRKIKTDINVKDMSTEGENEKMKYKLVMQYISGYNEEGKSRTNSFLAEVFLKVK